MADRPTLALEDRPQAVEELVAALQAAINRLHAGGINRQFADDVLWGSPFGAVVSGYDEIHAIHSRMRGSTRPIAATSTGSGDR